MLVYSFKNYPVNSNCYVIYQVGKEECMIIDPGTNESKEVLQFLNSKRLKPIYVILTHEHFDHIWGVQSLIDKFKCKVICSNLCGLRISIAKSNLSLFYDQVGFALKVNSESSESFIDGIFFLESQIIFKNTPGHTDSSICIIIENLLFTGDTLIPGEKTVTKLPTGNKEDLELTHLWLKELFIADDYIIYPGHGTCETSANLMKELNQLSL